MKKGVNISVILFVLVAGLFQADFSNWTWEPEGIYARLNNETQSGNTTDCKRESYFRSYFRPFYFGNFLVLYPGNHLTDMIGQNSTSADQTEVDHCALGHELECFMTFASPDNITSDRWPGVGGFTPYGFNGILKGLYVKMSENNLRF